jgi:hypothetical protein
VLVDWIYGHGPVPLPELASWPSPRLDNVAAPSTWDNTTNQIDPSSIPNRHLVPPTTADSPDAGQTIPTTEPVPLHPSHAPSFETSDPSTDFAIRLLKPRPTQGCAVVLSRIESHVYLDIVLSRIENHVYLDIDLPSRSWDAIQLPCTKSVTNDDSRRIGEGIKPLLLVIIVRGATTQQEYHSVCGQCEKRMGNKTGPPSLIDFHSCSNILTQSVEWFKSISPSLATHDTTKRKTSNMCTSAWRINGALIAC